MVGEFAAATASLKTAMDIGKAMLDAKGAYEQADLRLKIAELMGELATARGTLADAEDAARQRDAEIKRLNEALQIKSIIVKDGDAYFDIDADGKPTGEAYCMRCWQADHRLFHLSYPRRMDHPTVCPQCKTQYNFYRTQRHEKKG
ncbi:hypothetical protein [Dyella flagellata]|uniref:Uncharacterized protein n=1 Tax=Dyella flagellata TaxID=1867833 RepID=A0ABQ5XB22_9GAMM|nr:hypothetical protein [Dyella flagellata]GLQ87859.1 hypothetical protein GCM10007898_14270 [Dyella flagellata]